MSRENPIWGAPRIQAELKLLDYAVAESTVAKYRVRTRKPSSPTWKTFLQNHLHELEAVDFFTVPTVTFRVLHVFVVLSLDRRRVLHFHVTTRPSAEWTAQQVIDAFPFATATRFLMRDRDGIYGEYFRRRVKSMGFEVVIIAPRSPWQNPFVERLIGSIRCERLDHVIAFNEWHLLRILRSYFEYYHESRTHTIENASRTTDGNRFMSMHSGISGKFVAYCRGGMSSNIASPMALPIRLNQIALPR